MNATLSLLRRGWSGYPGFAHTLSRSTFFGGSIVVAIAVCAVLSPWIAPFSPDAQQLTQRLVPPVFLGGSLAHPLGTDALGRDYLSRLLAGAKLTLFIGLGATVISALIGISMGMVAGYFRGRVETVVGFFINVRLSMPIMLIMLSLVGLLGNSTALIMIVLSCFLWDRFAVVARSITLQLQDREFVLAAKAAGCTDLRILIGEILPNLARPLLVVATLEVAHAILLESALSFLGLGVKSPSVSWGLMIAEAKDYVFFEAWLLNIPGAMIFILVGAINLFCEGLKAGSSSLR
ncbi:ABC transporter permease [Microvirga alba]|uniref:ABC transporter permease n=1 Tax=Microvirga alba TaxID=2791025 RepID=A0A931FQ53_9HYPH|nr:ABC transporter permease [Microvirga alba]MBF9235490.1 ABC transporter permease [Microvirga alba]